mmetsp:Transcript_71169/g.123474  ORF Transcript_71169/g.123474 Transcript_71169/m.123474 type:complete len:552 (-) Transcript_71169:51-1706(-)
MTGGPPATPGSPNLVKESCPAFFDGCPYATSEQILDWVKAQRPDVLEKCPGFKEGCPFRQVQDMDGLLKGLQDLPASHASPEDALGKSTTGSEADAVDAGIGPESDSESQGQGQSMPNAHAHGALVSMLQVVHQASQSVKEAVGGDCPVFQQSCPFKNCLTSSGTALVLELETRSWVLVTLEAESLETARQDSSEAAVANEQKVAVAPVADAGSGQAVAPDEDSDMMGLALKLKEGTAVAHKMAESGHFVREFFKGRVPREVYRQMVVNLYHVYKALEEGLDACCEHQLLEPLYFPEELNRARALREDAKFFWGDDWEERASPSAVTLEYVARLREIAQTSPELLAPHAYTRYLGDLSGGQLLKRAAIRGFKLPKDTSEGVAFYIFKRVPDVKVFKNMYRARLDSLPADTATADAMVVEANYAFDLNTRMFQELDELAGFNSLPAPPRQAEAAPAAKASNLSSASSTASCPFAALAGKMPMPADHPPTTGTATKPLRRNSKTANSKAAQRSSIEESSVTEKRNVMQGTLLFAAVAFIALAFFWARFTTNSF